MKQALVIRTDLDMGRGKMAAQAAHAAVEAFQASDADTQARWRSSGGKKIVLGVASRQALFEITEQADRASIVTAVIRDAGHTELEPGTVTAVGIGPDRESRLDPITGGLALL